MKNYIRSERVRLGMTARELADKVGVSESTITAWENEKRDPNLSYLVGLAKMFGCSVDYLLGLSDERKAS